MSELIEICEVKSHSKLCELICGRHNLYIYRISIKQKKIDITKFRNYIIEKKLFKIRFKEYIIFKILMICVTN